MPGDLVGGCLEIVVRIVVEVVIQGFGELLWAWCQAVGEFSVWLFTFGRVALDERRSVLRGIIGIIVHAILIGLLILWIMATPGNTK